MESIPKATSSDEDHLQHDHHHILLEPTAEPVVDAAVSPEISSAVTVVEQSEPTLEVQKQTLNKFITMLKAQLKANEALSVDAEIELECLREEAGLLGREVQAIEQADWQGTLKGDNPMAYNEYLHLKVEFKRLVKNFVIEQAKCNDRQAERDQEHSQLLALLHDKKVELAELNKEIAKQKLQSNQNEPPKSGAILY